MNDFSRNISITQLYIPDIQWKKHKTMNQNKFNENETYLISYNKKKTISYLFINVNDPVAYSNTNSDDIT